ncbi:SDR family NAD(P)-dependent oxidoreductase [Acidimicrobiia bacterium]|nr:SDR family NAD(P)-dependent oxidoreductase [Acidimicrobiia bacterium]MDB4249834.1 SDR family NAD(P)-dependent oxidoreductase [Acidimicrobiia bacterium]
MKKIAIITGANKGLGLSVAQRLINNNYKVVLACRDKTKGENAQNFLGEDATFLELNLANLKSIETFTNEISKRYDGIDILYNNAGLIYKDFELTEEGFESMISVNYFGSYRLTLKLLDNLRENHGRMVQVSSLSMYLARKFSTENLHSSENFSPSTRYNLTNLYRSMFALELEKRTDDKVSITVAHPGITKSRQSRPYEVRSIKKSTFTYISTNISTGTEPIVEAISRSKVSAYKTFAPRILGIYGKPTTKKHNKLAYSQDLRDKLWQFTSEELGMDL